MPVEQVKAIERWKAEEVTVRARLRQPGATPREEQVERSGMEVFEAIFAGALPPAPIGDTLDYVPIHVVPGVAVFRGRHYNHVGTMRGGWFMTLLDSAIGCAMHATLPAREGFTTLELKVNMVRSLDEGVPLVRAEGKVIHAGRQVTTAEARIVGPDGMLCAHATTTCVIFDPSAIVARGARACVRPSCRPPTSRSAQHRPSSITGRFDHWFQGRRSSQCPLARPAVAPRCNSIARRIGSSAIDPRRW